MRAHRFTVRIESPPSESHITLRVFANGASAGLVTLRNDDGEANTFRNRLEHGNEVLAALRDLVAWIDDRPCPYVDLPDAMKAARAAVSHAESFA